MAKNIIESSYTTTQAVDRKTGEIVHKRSTVVTSGKVVLKGVSIFGAVCFILIIVSILGLLSDKGDTRTFYSFLDMLSNVPNVELGFSTSLLNYDVNLPDWLNWFEVFWEVLAHLLGVLAFFIQGLVNACIYIYYFIQWVFVL